MTGTIVKLSALVIAAVVVAAIAASLFTKKSFRVETQINAPPDAVWAVLMDTAKYPEWNPVFVEVDGPYALDTRVLNKVRDPSGNILKMTAKVATLSQSRELRQQGGVPGLLTFDHRWILEPNEGGTKVTQFEVDRGLWLWFWNSDWIEPAYTRVGDALRERVHLRN